MDEKENLREELVLLETSFEQQEEKVEKGRLPYQTPMFTVQTILLEQSILAISSNPTEDEGFESEEGTAGGDGDGFLEL
ncbi:MAG: hypothetical protein LBN24_00875 [Mediterranea sp.]|jgi:hypothetical protein|nr:hypothetical protein [Mediterranea sp.]